MKPRVGLITCISVIISFFIVVAVVSSRFLPAIFVGSSCEKNVKCIGQMTHDILRINRKIILLDMLISLVSFVSKPHFGQGTGWPRSYLKPLRLT